MLRFYQINFNHCEAASDLLAQSVRELRTNVAIISEPYLSPDEGCWIQSSLGKAAIWSCGRPFIRPISCFASRHFIRAKKAYLWIYSCYYPPSMSRHSFAAAMDELVGDACDH